MAYYPVDRSEVVGKGLHAPKPGLNSVGEYQVAGRPFVKTILESALNTNGNVTGTAKLANAAQEVSVDFPFVTSRIVVQNKTDAPLAVYFCSLTVADADDTNNSGVKVNGNYFVLPVAAPTDPLPTLDLKVKCRKVYVATYGAGASSSGYISVAAELTNIEESYDCDVDNIVGISG